MGEHTPPALTAVAPPNPALALQPLAELLLHLADLEGDTLPGALPPDEIAGQDAR